MTTRVFTLCHFVQIIEVVRVKFKQTMVKVKEHLNNVM